MKVLWTGLLLARLAAAASAAPAADLRLLASLRARASLPALSAVELSRLAAAPEALTAAKIEAARVFLAGINPNFEARVEPGEPATALQAIARDVAAARLVMAEAKLDVVRESLLVDGEADAQALDRVFTGSQRRLAAGARSLFGKEGEGLADLVLDGAPRQALRALDGLARRGAALADGPDKKSVKILRRMLKDQPVSRPIAEFERRLAGVRASLARRDFGAAVTAARRLMDAVAATRASAATRSALWADASALEVKARTVGALKIHLERGEPARALAGRVARAGFPYKGDPISPEPTRLQCSGDCGVHQAYNHPKLAGVRAGMPYGVFLDVVSAMLFADVRSEGMSDGQTMVLLKKLGLEPVARRGSTEGALLESLDAFGALMTTIRWRRGVRHAVLVQGAFFEDGAWKFVVIDSNSPAPQVLTYGELLVLGAERFDSVEAAPEENLPPSLRGLPDLQTRVEAAAQSLALEWAPERLPWWRRLLARFAR